MISRFFIDRPIFASVISIIITLAGIVSFYLISVAQYPDLTPPQVWVYASYPGASAEVIAESVAAPIEKEVNGVDDMIYMSSQSTIAGTMALGIVFKIGTNVEQAQVNVQNRVNNALPQLPIEVRREGVLVQKQSQNMLLIVAVQSPNGRFDELYTSNYASIHIVDELKRIPGVSDASILGARDYSMRIWLRPDRMAQLGVTVVDIVNAIQEQNSFYAVGLIGQSPTKNPIELTLPIAAKGRLVEPKEFENIVIRANSEGNIIYLRDIAYAELGARNYDMNTELSKTPTTLIGVYQQFGSNALDVANDIQNKMEELSKKFPSGLTYSLPYNTTNFINASIREVLKTIGEAFILVGLVVLIFLHSFRATLIPILAMVVSIVGTFAGMYFLGFSINTLTLFGIVLAIGIVVDDAIVVVENVERNIKELKLSPMEATYKAMEEVTGPLIAIVLVLCAVFVPVAFLGGMSGRLYNQFAITITLSVIISGIFALTLSPAIAARILKPHVEKDNRYIRGFNYVFLCLVK
jgi:multidrug efflux pump